MTYQNEGNPFIDRSIPWCSVEYRESRNALAVELADATRKDAEVDMKRSRRVEYVPSELHHTFNVTRNSGAIVSYRFASHVDVSGLMAYA